MVKYGYEFEGRGKGMELYYGGPIYTLHEEGERVEAVLVQEGKIQAVGTYEQLEPFATTHYFLNGHTLIPGLVDSHLHLIGYGMKLRTLQLGDVKCKQELLSILKETAKFLAPSEWIIAEGWNEFNLANDEMPSLQELDEIKHPILLHRVCHHVVFANTLAMKEANVHTNTPQPSDGIIGKTESGQLTGYFYDGAAKLLTQWMETTSARFQESIIQATRLAIQQLHRYGLVGAHSEDLSYYGHYENVLRAYDETIGKNEHFRVHLLVHHNVFEELHREGRAMYTPYIELGAMKIFADGSFGGATAALIDGYADNADHKGLLIHSEQQFERFVQLARSKNEAIAVHAIGDHAAELLISMIEKYPTPKGKRDRFIHACLLNEQLLARMRRLSQLIVDIQPAFVYSDFPWVEKRLGKERMKYAYNWAMLKDIPYAIGTDAPIEEVNPFLTIAAAVERNLYGDFQGNQALTVFEAIKGYTYGSAYAIGKEHERGLLKEGYVADFTILKENPFVLTTEQLKQVQVQATIVAGKEVYKSF